MRKTSATGHRSPAQCSLSDNALLQHSIYSNDCANLPSLFCRTTTRNGDWRKLCLHYISHPLKANYTFEKCKPVETKTEKEKKNGERREKAGRTNQKKKKNIVNISLAWRLCGHRALAMICIKPFCFINIITIFGLANALSISIPSRRIQTEFDGAVCLKIKFNAAITWSKKKIWEKLTWFRSTIEGTSFSQLMNIWSSVQPIQRMMPQAYESTMAIIADFWIIA